jgi:hypothetical protein
MRSPRASLRRSRAALSFLTSRFFSRPANTAPMASMASVISSLSLVRSCPPAVISRTSRARKCAEQRWRACARDLLHDRAARTAQDALATRARRSHQFQSGGTADRRSRGNGVFRIKKNVLARDLGTAVEVRDGVKPGDQVINARRLQCGHQPFLRWSIALFLETQLADQAYPRSGDSFDQRLHRDRRILRPPPNWGYSKAKRVAI